MAGAVTKDETFGAQGHIENTEKKYLTVEKTEFEGKTQKNILCSTNIRLLTRALFFSLKVSPPSPPLQIKHYIILVPPFFIILFKKIWWVV